MSLIGEVISMVVGMFLLIMIITPTIETKTKIEDTTVSIEESMHEHSIQKELYNNLSSKNEKIYTKENILEDYKLNNLNEIVKTNKSIEDIDTEYNKSSFYITDTKASYEKGKNVNGKIVFDKKFRDTKWKPSNQTMEHSYVNNYSMENEVKEFFTNAYRDKGEIVLTSDNQSFTEALTKGNKILDLENPLSSISEVDKTCNFINVDKIEETIGGYLIHGKSITADLVGEKEIEENLSYFNVKPTKELKFKTFLKIEIKEGL